MEVETEVRLIGREEGKKQKEKERNKGKGEEERKSLG